MSQMSAYEIGDCMGPGAACIAQRHPTAYCKQIIMQLQLILCVLTAAVVRSVSAACVLLPTPGSCTTEQDHACLPQNIQIDHVIGVKHQIKPAWPWEPYVGVEILNHCIMTPKTGRM